jgi:16S rRNA (uracil1498-N3)-methyltransferase
VSDHHKAARRFFIDQAAAAETCVALNEEESRHLVRVLRLKIGDEIEMLDGKGSCYRGIVEELGKRVQVYIRKKATPLRHDGVPLWVCQGDLKGKKMDQLVQQCTELGVDRFIVFTSSRSQGRVDERRRQRKLQRWQALIRSACKQSGRLLLMDVELTDSFSALLNEIEKIDGAQRLLFWEHEPQRLLTDVFQKRPVGAVCLLLGPEGGFSRSEVIEARRCGWHSVSLGSRILRAETATVAAVSVCRHLLGVM